MADGTVSLRQRVINVLKLHRDGHYDEALWCASQMLTAQNNCALLMNFFGDLLMEARSRVMQIDPEMSWKHLKDAVKCYEIAADNAPNCIQTSASYANALLEYHCPLNVPVDFFSGVHTQCPDDPYLHHAAYALDKTSKEQRMHCAEEKWLKALSDFNKYIAKSEVPDDEAITTFFTWLDGSQSITGSEIFAYAANTSAMFPSSIRARYLPYYVALHLVGNGYWNDEKSAEMLQWAVKNIREQTVKYSKSLIFALIHVKLLLALGQYTAAETECYRSLEIEEPDDPSEHDVPIGSTGGQNYLDRVSEIRDQLRQHLQKIVLAAQCRWRILRNDQDDDFLSVSFQDVLDQYSGIDQAAVCTVNEAIQFFETHKSWSLWMCPYSDECTFTSTDPVKIHRHLVEEHLLVSLLEEDMVTIFEERLEMHGNRMSSHNHVISFSGQPATFFFLSLDDLFQSLFLLSHGDEIWSLQELRARRCGQATSAIEMYKQKLIDSSALQVNQVVDIMEKLWVQLLEAFRFDYRDALLPLLASLKWEELKNRLQDVTTSEYYDKGCLRDMFAHDPNQSSAGATDVKVLAMSQADVHEKGQKERDVHMEICNNLNPHIDVNKPAESAIEQTLKVPARAARLHSSNQATRYGVGALHRPMRKKALHLPTRLEQMYDEEKEYCRSNDKFVHQEYYRILLRAEPLHLCSVCFFDLATIKPVKQVLYHYQTHGIASIRCELCSARFATESLLLLHKTYCHEPPGPLEKKRFRWSMKQGLTPSSRKDKEKPG